MSYLNKMYGSKTPQGVVTDKNPNRVLGGLKGAGVNSYSLLGEDGVEKQVPTQAYVQALEEKIRAQEARVAVLEKQIRRLNSDQKTDRETIRTTLRR